MGFEFKPSIWFVCRYCRQAFRYLYKLKEHKVESHLGECLKTKCLIFEERALDHEWIPYPNELECEDGPVSSSSSADTSNRRNSYKNPYVSLEPLTPKQLDGSRNKNSLSYSRSVPAKTKSRSCRGTKRTADKLVTLQQPGDDEPCTEKKCNLDADRVETTIAAPAVENNIVFDSEVPKVELTIEELHQLAKNAVTPTSTSLLATESSIEDKVCSDSQEFELEDREFIVASIVKRSDGTENIQFVSTHIPTAITAAESTLQKQTGTFGIFSRISGDLDLLNTTDISAANNELPIGNEIHEGVTSDVLDFQVEKESNGHITFETRNLFKHDYESICEPLSPEEYLPIETTNLSQTQNRDETVHDVDNYECPDNIESRAEDENNDQVIEPGSASQGHSKINQGLPPVKLTPEELLLPLLDWLNREKTNDPSNVILLDPNPTNEANETFVDVNNLNPMKCVLCKLKLTSDTRVKEHVKVCWTFNKTKHVYCVACEKTYSCPFSLTRHCNKFHSPIISMPSREIAEVIDGDEAQAVDFNSKEEEVQHNSQIITDSTSNAFRSEADPAASRSRYSTRRRKSRVNYSETQACRGCAKDFYTVEDVEDHEKLCQLFRNKTKENKQAKETIDEEIQVIGSITKNNRTFEIASDEDDDKYESPNSESDIENDDADFVIGRRPRSQCHSQINPVLPTVTLSPEDLSLPLLDWVTKEKASDPSKVILLDPDPTTETLPVAVNDVHPMKCVLCQLVLISDTQVKEHVKVCWTFNEEKHLYCVPCKKAFCSPYSLKRHCKRCHVPSNLITSSVIVETVDGTEAEAPAINSTVAITKTCSQINSDSVSVLNVSETNLSELGSRHSTRRKKLKLNYSKIQACRGCANDFYTVEDLEYHEQVCSQLRSKNIENKETENKETEDDEIEVLRSTEEKTFANEVVGDDDNYECPGSSESNSDLESDGYVTDPGHPSHYSPRRRGAVPTITLSPEDLSLPLADWLRKEKINDLSNVILLDPDPTSKTTVVEVTSLHPTKCVLCNQELTLDTQVKEHVKVCWHFRKTKHTYCVPCKKSYNSTTSLDRHRLKVHELIPGRRIPNLNFISRKHEEPLKEWLVLQKQATHLDGSSNVILIDPDPTLIDPDSTDYVINIDNGKPVTCLLCQMLLFSEPEVRNHVENCWWHNKQNHRRCVPCEFTFDTLKLLRNHQMYDHVETTSATNEESEDSDPEQVDVNNDVIRVDLAEWLRKCQGKSSNVIRLDPDPIKATGPLTISKKSPIKCMLCNTKLTTEFSLKAHVKMCWRYNKKVHGYCILCEKAFSGEISLNEHNCNEHFPGPHYPYNCTACRTGFKDRVSKKLHTSSRLEFLNRIVSAKYAESSTVSSKPPQTSLCEWLRQENEENPSNCILLEPDPLSIAHNFEGVREANPVKCKLCFREFTSELVLRSHVKICWIHNRRIHVHCVQCNKTYETMDRLKLHKKLKHCKGPKPIYKCNMCDRKYFTLKHCKNHQQFHVDPDKAKPFKCETCHNSYQWKSMLYTHMLTHSSERTFKCPHCPKAFIKKSSLNLHFAVHTLGKEDPTDPSKPSGTSLNCRFCDRFFTIKEKLKDHERSHTGERPYKCKVPNCSHTFSSLTYRTIHTKRKHGQQLGLTRFLCSSCGKTFPVQSELDYHVQRWHTEAKDKPFKCPHEGCTKRFGMKFQIAPHMLIHSGEKPFQCEQCGLSFASKQTFKKHQLSHDDQGPGNKITCQLCPKTFRENRALQRHLKHHEEKVPKKNVRSKLKFKCKVCGKGYSTKPGLKKHEETHDDDEDESEEEEEEEEEQEEAESDSEESETSESSESENSDQDGEKIENNST